MTWEELGITNYRAYFTTSHWKYLKNKWLVKNVHASCFICKTKKKLILHHATYDNLGKEKLNKDVYIVCYNCHQKIHYLFVFWKIKLFRVPLVKNTLLFTMYIRKSIRLYLRLKPIQATYCLYMAFKYLLM